MTRGALPFSAQKPQISDAIDFGIMLGLEISKQRDRDLAGVALDRYRRIYEEPDQAWRGILTHVLPEHFQAACDQFERQFGKAELERRLRNMGGAVEINPS